jgi:hypothetical protein
MLIMNMLIAKEALEAEHRQQNMRTQTWRALRARASGPKGSEGINWNGIAESRELGA